MKAIILVDPFNYAFSGIWQCLRIHRLGITGCSVVYVCQGTYNDRVCFYFDTHVAPWPFEWLKNEILRGAWWDGNVLITIGVIQPGEVQWLWLGAAPHIHLGKFWWNVMFAGEAVVIGGRAGGYRVKGRAADLKDVIDLADWFGVLHPGQHAVQGHNEHVIQRPQPEQEAVEDEGDGE